MKNRMIKAAGLLGFALLLAGSATATDSSFYWSDASGARGTLYWESICLSNSTFGGTIVSGTTLSGNGSGLTNLNAGYLTAGDMPVARGSYAATNYDAVGKATTTLAGNGAAVTNLNGANLSAGNVTLDRVSNVFNTAGVTLGAYNANACTNYSYLNLVGGRTYIITNLVSLTGPTNLCFFTNGVLVNTIVAP